MNLDRPTLEYVANMMKQHVDSLNLMTQQAGNTITVGAALTAQIEASNMLTLINNEIEKLPVEQPVDQVPATTDTPKPTDIKPRK